MTDLIDELLCASKQSAILGDVTFKGAYGFKKFELDVNEKLGKALGKATGHYVTLKMHQNFLWSRKISVYLTNQLTKSLKKFFQSFGAYKKVLVVGLGNENMVCDSLGKLVTGNLIVLDQTFAKESKLARFCVLNPSVEGLTGINSFEIIKAETASLKPDFVIAIDSLTANDVSRLGFTIQLSDAGINPGGGVKDCHNVLNKQTLGVPVLSVGVPLLISIKNLTDIQPQSFYQHFTPKEIDFVVKRCSKIISDALNLALYSPQVAKLFF